MSIQIAKEGTPVGAVIVGEFRGLRINEGVSSKTGKPYRMVFAVLDVFGFQNIEVNVSDKDEAEFSSLKPRDMIVLPIVIQQEGFNQSVRFKPRK